MSGENNVTIIFGLGPAGLFLSRQLKKIGRKIIGIGKVDDIGRYSNTLDEYYAIEEASKLICRLNSIREKYKDTLEAYICSDQYLTILLENIPDVFSSFKIIGPDKKLFKLIANKRTLMDFCSSIGVNFPFEYRLSDISQLNAITYPIILKPNIKRGSSPLKKISIINNQDELRNLLKVAQSYGIMIGDLIVQKYIYGNNLFEYGYGGYFKNGHIICDACFIQLRQYPQGVCCYTLEVFEDSLKKRIQTQPMKFIKSTSYTGFIQFDIKEDCRTNELFVLDINPRPWGSIGMLAPKCVKKSILDNDYAMPVDVFVKWRFPLKEIASVLNRNNVPYAACNRIMKGIPYIKIWDLYDKSDKCPFFMQFIILVIKFVKKCFRKH